MLKLRGINKSYRCGNRIDNILKDVNVDFRCHELVFILGKSGSGKTTLLNIIGGLTRSDTGDIFYDSENICNFSNKKLDGYRNSSVGFIFQNYNLIETMNVNDNIKLAQTINRNKNRRDIILKQLDLFSKKNIQVNRLSGGEKQRVAIARAIINDPDIILADEPTGALDSTNGIQIMDILKSISLKKLVIVVSHDLNLAKKYADRIININDGKVSFIPINDDGSEFRKIEKKRIGLLKIINIAVKNIKRKLSKNLLISLAISLGVFGIMLVVCLSDGINKNINDLEQKAVSVFPIVINNETYTINDERVKGDNKIVKNNSQIITNKIDSSLMNYLNQNDKIKYLNYDYDISLPLITEKYNILNNFYFKEIPKINNYEVIYGNDIKTMYDILLKVDSYNNVSAELLEYFGIDRDINYNEILGSKIRVILNDDYYQENDKYYSINTNLKELYDNSSLELTIVGIVREREVIDDTDKIYYSKELLDFVFSKNKNSKIVQKQLLANYNVLGGAESKIEVLNYLGYDSLPCAIDIYVDNLKNKEIVLKYLDNYNKKVVYIDMMSDAINIIKNFMKVITICLISFSSISIIVSMLMILILTSNRVIERIKEIGILRSLGASKSDVRRIFNIENIILGIISSCISILGIYLLKSPINDLSLRVIDISDILVIDKQNIILIFIINVILIFMAGSIPANKAGKSEIYNSLIQR